MQALYNKKRYIEPADGFINIFARGTSPEEYKVTLYQRKDMQTAFVMYIMDARSFESATRIYNEKVLPEIVRKERLYIASGKFDRQSDT